MGYIEGFVAAVPAANKEAYRRHAAAARLLDVLPARPVLDVPTAAALAGCSAEGARRALNELEMRGVLRLIAPDLQRDRIWEAPELLATLDDFAGGAARHGGAARR